LDRLKHETKACQEELDKVIAERKRFAETHTFIFHHLLCNYSIASQILTVEQHLESTMLVYRITGWVPDMESKELIHGLDNLAEGRVAIRLYEPNEVPGVNDGYEEVPVKLKHGSFVGAFERLVLSYGTPKYGTIDPMPVVAVYFTLLFGLMFGDAGQGLVFVLLGFVLHKGWLKNLLSWQKFAPIFVGIGCASTLMGFLTGEFFGNHHALAPLGNAVAGIFGGHYPFLHLMPGAGTINKVFYFFLFTLGVGFVINSSGVIMNIVNQFSMGRPGKALFGQTGLSGALFFWYAIFMAVRIAFFGSSFQIYDVVILSVILICLCFSEPFARIVDKERPIFEDGPGIAIVHGIVGILETLSS
jgi:V/A-type H+-transporting ATPase subunit I